MVKSFFGIWALIFLVLLVLSLFGGASMQVIRWISPVGRPAFNAWTDTLPDWFAIELVCVVVSGFATYSRMKSEAGLDVESGTGTS